jgi:putative SOS response-associated peptidase YedK
MCYYNGQRVTRVEYIRLKQLEKFVANLEIMNQTVVNGFEYGQSAVLRAIPGAEDFDVVPMEWGFLPDHNRWPFVTTREKANNMRRGYTDSRGKYNPAITTLNAMAEEMLLPNKMYRDAALNRRCLVLSSGFFEWRHVYPLNKRTGQPLKTATKYPYHITVKDAPYFYMAGIWNPWFDELTGEHIDTFAIVTTQANSIMAQVHNSKKRMPTILDEQLGYEWMFGNLSEERIKEIAKTQFPAELMEACTIARDFQSAVEPTEIFNYEELSALEVNIG